MNNNPNIAGPSTYKINLPEPSEWKCYMFGGREGHNGIISIIQRRIKIKVVIID